MLSLQIGTKKITTERPSFVMGICNATSDSFYKKSRGGIKKAFELIEQGADIIDIGAESTRPGFSEISSEEQIKKIIPIIKAIRKKSDIPISVDTRSSVVMSAAINEGADILNDVSSLSSDKKMIDILQNNEISVILMHGFMQNEDKKSSVDIVKEVSDFFYEKIEFLKENDIDLSKVILDPGIGFGKTFEENIELIKNPQKICNNEFPVLMALSRKRCIGAMTNKEVEDRLVGTISANVFSVINGAKIIRVHDVWQAIDSMNVLKYML